MRNEWDEDEPSEESRATAAGMVEAVTQDVELVVDKMMDTAEAAVEAVEETLGLRPSLPARTKKAKPKAKSRAIKVKVRAAKATPRKVAKTKARKVAKSAKAKRPAKAKASKAKKGRR